MRGSPVNIPLLSKTDPSLIQTTGMGTFYYVADTVNSDGIVRVEADGSGHLVRHEGLDVRFLLLFC